uniref:Uncharacterized protein n=1 Tax=Dulem virus 42 TaxID=3145760 RepID=A0AAU8B8R9_9CAUD
MDTKKRIIICMLIFCGALISLMIMANNRSSNRSLEAQRAVMRECMNTIWTIDSIYDFGDTVTEGDNYNLMIEYSSKFLKETDTKKASVYMDMFMKFYKRTIKEIIEELKSKKQNTTVFTTEPFTAP